MGLNNTFFIMFLSRFKKYFTQDCLCFGMYMNFNLSSLLS